jgi:hypothetical protein
MRLLTKRHTALSHMAWRRSFLVCTSPPSPHDFSQSPNRHFALPKAYISLEVLLSNETWQVSNLSSPSQLSPHLPTVNMHLEEMGTPFMCYKQIMHHIESYDSASLILFAHPLFCSRPLHRECALSQGVKHLIRGSPIK